MKFIKIFLISFLPLFSYADINLEERTLYFEAWHSSLQLQYLDKPNSQELMRAAIQPYYESSIKPYIHSMSAKALRSAYTASQTMDFYLQFGTDTSVFEQQLLLWEELTKRNLATTNDAQGFIYSLLRLHHWDLARILIKNFPLLNPNYVPKVIESNLPIKDEMSYYGLSPDRETLTLKPFTFDRGPKIILFGFCHFAWDAINSLSSDSEIRSLMNSYGKVVVPPNFIDYDFLGDLQDQYPDFKPYIAFDYNSWLLNGIQMFNSPTLYFILNGKIKSQSNASLEDFCEGVQKIGLPLPSICLHTNRAMTEIL